MVEGKITLPVFVNLYNWPSIRVPGVYQTRFRDPSNEKRKRGFDYHPHVPLFTLCKMMFFGNIVEQLFTGSANDLIGFEKSGITLTPWVRHVSPFF